jgi:hypothetical protein
LHGITQVRDEKGRRRLHGAFTGGFSAGYFNTVGSKEGNNIIISLDLFSRSNMRQDGRLLHSSPRDPTGPSKRPPALKTSWTKKILQS